MNTEIHLGPNVSTDGCLGSKCYYRWGPLLHLGPVISLVPCTYNQRDLPKRTEQANTIVKSHCLGDLVTPILGLSSKLLFGVILSACVSRRTERREINRRRDAGAVIEREIRHVGAYLSMENNYA